MFIQKFICLLLHLFSHTSLALLTRDLVSKSVWNTQNNKCVEKATRRAIRHGHGAGTCLAGLWSLGSHAGPPRTGLHATLLAPRLNRTTTRCTARASPTPGPAARPCPARPGCSAQLPLGRPRSARRAGGRHTPTVSNGVPGTERPRRGQQIFGLCR